MAPRKVNTVVKPRVDLGAYYHHETAGQTDGLTLTLKDLGSTRTYLDIHHAIRPSLTTEVTNAALASLCTLVLSSMASASWDDFQEAFETMAEGSVARKDVENARHWAVARSHGKWSTGGAMSASEKIQRLAWSAPFKF